MELISLNKTDLPKTNQNGLNYSSVDENLNKQEKSTDQGEDEYEDDSLTDFQGFMLLVPEYVGIGYLGYPYMVKLLGLWVGSAVLLLYGILAALGALILAGSTQRLTERTGERFGDIGSVSEMSMKIGPPCLQPYARIFRYFIDLSIILTFYLCLADMLSLMNVFGKDVLHQFIDIGISDTLSIVVISVLLLPVYLTRRIRLLSFIATAGNAVLFGIFIISFQYLCRDLPDISTRSPAKFVDYFTFTSFTNSAMFSYGGIVLVSPVRNRMKNKKNCDGWNGVIGVVHVFVICFHISCGFFGYLKFGEKTQVIYLLNLPGDNRIYTSLKILTFLTLYCTMGMSVFVIINIIWPPLKDRFNMETIQKYGEYTCRLILLILACTFTVLVPEFELLMSFSGCFGEMFTTLLVPYIITALILYGDAEPKSLTGKVKRGLIFGGCVSMLMFGIYSMIAGIGVALYLALFHIKV